MDALNWVDFIIIGVVALSALVSLIRGLIPEVLSLATWVAAFAVAMKFFPEIAPRFEPYLANETFRNVGAFAAIFVSILIVGALINYLIGSMVKATGFKATDRILGIAFGATRGALVIALAVLGLGLTTIPEESWWQESKLMPKFEEAADWLKEKMPENVRSHFDFEGDKKPSKNKPESESTVSGETGAAAAVEASSTEQGAVIEAEVIPTEPVQ